MDIKDIKFNKSVLEDEIADLLEAFEKETGTKIISIKVKDWYNKPSTEPFKTVNITVKID